MVASITRSLVLAAVLAAWSGSANGQSVAAFYSGRTVSIGVVAAGGLYALNAQLLSRHMPRHIPGHPTIVVTVRSGAGGLTNLNHLASAAPRDGLAMALVPKDLAFFQLIGANGIHYDARTLNWIGRVNSMYTTMLVWHGSPAKSLADMKKTQVVMAASGANHPSSMFPHFMNRELGTKLKVVTGYRGAADIFLAFERGEAQGTSIAWDVVRSNKSDWIRQGKIVPVVQLSVEKPKDLPNVPLLADVMIDADGKRMARILVSGSKVGMALAVPPGVPTTRVDALRKAFDQTMNDPAYRAEAASHRIDIDPLTGKELQRFIQAEMKDVPSSLIDKLNRLIAP
jgi:tripartite-type tricarboxylate transporter receptor subunit TctC